MEWHAKNGGEIARRQITFDQKDGIPGYLIYVIADSPIFHELRRCLWDQHLFLETNYTGEVMEEFHLVDGPGVEFLVRDVANPTLTQSAWYDEDEDDHSA